MCVDAGEAAAVRALPTTSQDIHTFVSRPITRHTYNPSFVSNQIFIHGPSPRSCAWWEDETVRGLATAQNG